MQSCWFIHAVVLVYSNLYTNDFLPSKFVHEFLKFAYEFFSSVFENSCTNWYANSQVNFVHEIRTKFVIFDKLGKISYEFARIREGYVTNDLYCSLNIYFLCRFPYIDGPSFSPYKPLQNVDFQRSVTYSFFQELYSHINKNSGENVRGYVSHQNSK